MPVPPRPDTLRAKHSVRGEFTGIQPACIEKSALHCSRSVILRQEKKIGINALGEFYQYSTGCLAYGRIYNSNIAPLGWGCSPGARHFPSLHSLAPFSPSQRHAPRSAMESSACASIASPVLGVPAGLEWSTLSPVLPQSGQPIPTA